MEFVTYIASSSAAHAAAVIGLAFTAFGLLLTAWSMRAGAVISLRNQRMTVIQHCNLRYDEIYKYKIEILKNKSPEERTFMEDSYFRRYYGLKGDQIDYWLSGYVDPETILSWFWSTTDAFLAANKTQCGCDHDKKKGTKPTAVSYQDGWAKVKESHEYINPRLFELIEKIQLDFSKEENPEKRYAKLYFELEDIEKKEKRLILLLAQVFPLLPYFTFRRRMSDLLPTLSPTVERHILDIRALSLGRHRVHR